MPWKLLAANWEWIVVICLPIALCWFGNWGKSNARW